jgi:beta-galactosidase
MPKLAPYQIDFGGKIILMQIENEYGYYGNDTAYLEFLRDTMRENGITVPFATSDGPWKEEFFKEGMVDGALPTGNFGSGAEWQFGQMRKFMGDGKPLMCMEFWNGWFDAWGEEHHTTSPEKAAAELDALLSRGSINFYMFEGGTNFGFMSGRNEGNKTADVTSYDYDSPLTEDGRITEKYDACKAVISKYTEINEVPLTTEIKRKEYGEVKCCGKAGLFDVLESISEPVQSQYPMTMEEIGQNYGYILYRAKVKDFETVCDVMLDGAADRVQGFRGNKPVFTAETDHIGDKFELKDEDKFSGGSFDLLCENIGRVNFGTAIEKQRKGISGGVVLNGHRHYGFDIFPLPLDEEQVGKVRFGGYSEGVLPAFYLFEFEADECGDTFLDADGFGKGVAFINGFNLGRFWEIGPQRRLYVPAPLIRKGVNRIVLFETEGKAADRILLAGEPDLG